MTGEKIRSGSRLTHASLVWDDNAPRSALYGDIYFSGDGEAETGHVFLAGNDLAARFAAARLFSIGELGFGAGLNFLKTWDLWRRTPKPDGARLHYFSIEGFPLRAEDMARAHAAWPGLADLSARLRAALPPGAAGRHRLEIDDDVTLTLGLGEAGALLAGSEGRVDAWFFDGFSPAKNPEMWRPELFEEAARLSNSGATFATYTVAGAVRRAVEAAGFAHEKRPGYGAKREMLAGRLAKTPAAKSRRAPWFHDAAPRPISPGATLGIIGAGIAGASLAYAARRAGLMPTLIDAGGLANMAAGALAGIVMPRLDLGDSPAARFFTAAYLHTIRLLNALSASGEGGNEFFNPCGALLGAAGEEEKERQRRIVDARALPAGWIEAADRGLFFPQAGVVDPAAYAAALAAGAERLPRRVARIEHTDDGPCVRLDDNSSRVFDAVVIANGVEALKFREARTLPLAAIAGQTDWFAEAPAPQSAIVHGSYAAPAPRGGLVIGATYEKCGPDAAAHSSLVATRSNIERVAAFAPDLVSRLDPAASRPRAGIRCQTPDRLPVAGPLPDLSFFGGAYDDLRLGMRRDYPPAGMLPATYILSGLGSRGLVTAPLAAALIVAEMTGEPAPVDHEIAEALHPARFFIRDLKRARTVRKA